MPKLKKINSLLQLDKKLPEVTKAKIEILNRSGKKIGEDIEVLFNPAQYTMTSSSKYTVNRYSSTDAPSMMYTGGKASTLSMELFFDTSAVQDVSGILIPATNVAKKVKEFEELVYIKGNMHSPPIVKFIWGTLNFRGVVTEIKSTFLKFAESGMPIQAKVSLSLMAFYKLSDKKRVSPFESPDRTKCRMVREDYSIWDMAKNEYGDVSKWKIIARANHISNPLEIPPGTIIKIPAL